MSAYILAIDIGTQGTKCAVFDTASMQAVTEEFEEAQLITPGNGAAFQEPDDILGSVRRTISRALSDAQINGADIKAVGLTGQADGIIGVGADGSASTVYDSGRDTRCVKYAEQMRQKAGSDFLKINGAPIACGQGPKIVWLKNEDADAYTKTAKFVPLHAFVGMQICGLDACGAYTDYTTLSYAGFADNLNKTWSKQLLDAFDVDEAKMPKIVAPFDIIGKVSADFAKSTGLAEGTPVAAGLVDTSAAIFGTNMTKEGRVEDWGGTDNLLAGVVCSYKPDIEHGVVQLLRAPMDGTWYAAIAVAGGDFAMRWFMNTLTGEPDSGYEQLDKEAANVPIGCQGVMYIPDVNGEVPETAPGTKAGYLGLDWQTTRAHMYRAIMEAVCYRYCTDIGILKSLYPQLDTQTIYSAAASVQSPLFNQMKADVLNTKLAAYELTDTALLGAGVVAGTAASLFDKLEDAVGEPAGSTKTYEPRAEEHEAYCKVCMTYNEKLAKINKALVD